MTTYGQRAEVAGRRLRYDEGCLAANALNVVGDRWGLLVVRELLLSPKRFQAIRAGLPGITAAVLSARLDQLRADGLVEWHTTLRYYELTPLGQALRPVVLELARWGVRHPAHDPTKFISPTSLMLSMSIMFDKDAARGRRDVAGFDCGSETFTIRLDGAGGSQVGLQVADDIDFVLSGTGNSLAAAVYGPRPLSDLVDAGVVQLLGDAGAAQAFIDLFALAPWDK